MEISIKHISNIYFYKHFDKVYTEYIKYIDDNNYNCTNCTNIRLTKYININITKYFKNILFKRYMFILLLIKYAHGKNC